MSFNSLEHRAVSFFCLVNKKEFLVDFKSFDSAFPKKINKKSLASNSHPNTNPILTVSLSFLKQRY